MVYAKNQFPYLMSLRIYIIYVTTYMVLLLSATNLQQTGDEPRSGHLTMFTFCCFKLVIERPIQT